MKGSIFSGTGGQLDFVRRAFALKGGKSFLALCATAKGGTISRVIPWLPRGAVVMTTRVDTHRGRVRCREPEG